MKLPKTQLLCAESCGGNGNFDGMIYITSEKYDALSGGVKNLISFKASECLHIIQHKIEMEWAKAFEYAKRKDHVAKLSTLFTDAGFKIIHVKEIDNQYSGDACYYANPWVIVTTKAGLITLGWRKRVLNLDWSDSDITADGRELFKEEKTTSGERFVHCWGYDKVVEYLKKLLMVHLMVHLLLHLLSYRFSQI